MAGVPCSPPLSPSHYLSLLFFFFHFPTPPPSHLQNWYINIQSSFLFFLFIIIAGISGAPGVGKSTFIESFGSFLTANNHKVSTYQINKQ